MEKQITGKEEHGGLQIEVYPMKGEEYDRRFPVPGSPRMQTISNRSRLGAGGLMKQQIFEDIYDEDTWETTGSRLFVHLANSFAWQAITGHQAPATPCTAEAYAQRGLPWYDYYLDGIPVSKGGTNLKGIKSVMELGFQKGLGIFPSNEKVEKIVVVNGPHEIRNGTW